MTPFSNGFARPMALSLLAASVVLSGCGNDSNPRPGTGDDHDHGGLRGRLVFTNAGSDAHAYVYDLDAGEMLPDLHLDYPAHSLYASPGKRFAVITQRDTGANPNQVQFVDAGLFAHGDHIDAVDPSLVSLTLSGETPAHYRAVEDQAALFFDGATASNRFVLFTDASLEAASIIAADSSLAAHHGIAEPRGEFVLTSNATRDAIEVHELHGDHFHLEETLAEPCTGLHGGGSLEDFAAFGCDDGVLVVEQTSTGFIASKVTTPLRVTQVSGHHALSQFATFATGNQVMYAVDPVAGTQQEIDWSNGAGATRSQHQIDAHGEHLLVLDTTGTLHVLEADDWSYKGSVAVLGNVTGAQITTSGTEDIAYITDPANEAILAVDLETVTLLDDERIEPGFAPVGLAWTGVVEAGDEHDHAH